MRGAANPCVEIAVLLTHQRKPAGFHGKKPMGFQMSSTIDAAVRLPANAAPESRETILQAAETLFLAQGFSNTTMQQIARECGVSKKTIYQLFRDKVDLFTAVIDRDEGFVVPADDNSGNDPTGRRRLASFLEAFAKHALQQKHLSLLRIIIAESRSEPDLASRFLSQNLLRAEAVTRLEIVRLPLARQPVMPAEELASVLISAVIADNVMRALLGNDEQERESAHLRRRIDALLAALLPP